jgi:hypothetical protein
MKDEGEAVNPEGSPEAVTETVPLKPSKGFMDTCTVDEDPGAIAGEDGVAEMPKEGGGGGGEPDDPPPHAESKRENPLTVIPTNLRAVGCQLEPFQPRPRLRVLVNSITSCSISKSMHRKQECARIAARWPPRRPIDENDTGHAHFKAFGQCRST